ASDGTEVLRSANEVNFAVCQNFQSVITETVSVDLSTQDVAEVTRHYDLVLRYRIEPCAELSVSGDIGPNVGCDDRHVHWDTPSHNLVLHRSKNSWSEGVEQERVVVSGS